MSNLLDRSSIVLTPTAYNNGEALCIKPDDASGDFQFSRNSAATRVNAQGLVENVQILSSNLVQNGDFSEEGVQEVSNGSFSQESSELITNGDFATDSNWAKNPNWTISGGTANCDGTSDGSFFQGSVIQDSKQYLVTYTISNLTQGGLRVQLSGTQGVLRTLNGTYTEYITSGSNPSGRVSFDCSSSPIGSIDNVSVREVGQDWTLGSGWSIAEDKAVCDGTQISDTFLYQNIGSQSNKTIKYSFTVNDYVSGTLKTTYFGATGTTINSVSANGDYTFYVNVQSGHNGNTGFKAEVGFIGSITNISVKEVGQNWLYSGQSEVSYNSGRIYSSDGSFSELYQEILSANKTYRLTFEIIEDSGGSLKIGTTRGGEEIASNVSGVGSFNYIFNVSSVNRLAFARLSGATDIRIDNISVIEITDDTNLPRINYEGFSYQDALGSELIVNGGFDTDSNWSKTQGWNISGGTANCDGSQTGNTYLTSQSGNAVIGKTYKVRVTTSGIISGWTRIRIGGVDTSLISTNGSYDFTITTTASTDICRVQGNIDFIGSIDKVSVKEYLGQSVVPNSGCGSWLFESQSTNLITQSELFSDSYWTKQQITITQNATISPSGLIDASMISEDNTNNYHRIRRNISLSVDATLSIFAKKGTNDKFLLWSGLNGVGFDLTLGTINNVSGLNPPSSSSIKDFGNGWYRCSITDNSISAFEVFSLQDFSGFIYQGSSTNNFYIWGAQLEQQTYATSYIPTSGQANGVTRNQDVCINGGSLATINSTSGTLYFEGAALSNDGTSRYISISDGTLSNAIKIYYFLSGGFVFFQKLVNGVRTTNVNTTSITKTDFNKIAIRYNSTEFNVFANGVNILNNADANVFAPNTLNTLHFTDANGISNNFFGKTKCLAVFPYLTDSELTELTTI